MPLASSSAIALRIHKETTFGVIPTTGAPQVMRFTGETLKFNLTKESSKEINKNRTISSVVPVSAGASGGVNSEMYYAGNDELLASTMQSTWSAFGTAGEGIATATTSVATGLITASAATSGANIFTALRNGQWVRIKSGGVNNGKVVRIHPSTAITTTTLPIDPSTPLTASSGESIQVQSSRLTHGTTQTSWTIERENSDIGVFIAYTGMTPSKFTVSMASASLNSMNFEFMGKGAIENTVTNLTGTPVEANAYEITSGVSGAAIGVWMDGVPVTGTFVKSVSIDFDNALRSQEAIGTLGAVGIGSGTINCTLTMSVYFANKDTFTKFRTNTNTNFQFISTDEAGNGYIFTVPKGNISDWTSNGSAKDQDQMVDITVTALEDRANANPLLRKVLIIDRVGVAVT